MEYILSFEWFSVDVMLNIVYVAFIILVGMGILKGFIKLGNFIFARLDKKEDK